MLWAVISGGSQRRAVFVALALSGSACSGNTTAATPGEGVAGGTSVPGASDQNLECVEVREYLDEAGRAAERIRSRWSAKDRVLTTLASDAPNAAPYLQSRYRDDGQVIAAIGLGPTFQHDYQYDAHGNPSSFAASQPAAPDVMRPATDTPTLERAYANEYDESGRLTTSTASESGEVSLGNPPVASTFSEDADGRCARIDSDNQSTQVFSYDDAGRLEKSDRSDARGSRFIIETTFDGQGRPLVSTETWQGAPGIRSGTVVTTYSHRADGSQVVEVVNGLADSGGAHTVTTRSPGCSDIDSARGKPADARCRVAL